MLSRSLSIHLDVARRIYFQLVSPVNYGKILPGNFFHLVNVSTFVLPIWHIIKSNTSCQFGSA
jgi:hypothetical protein